MTSPSEFLTDTQLAERWQMHRKSLIRWRSQRKGPPFIAINGKILYKMADVENYEQANTQANVS